MPALTLATGMNEHTDSNRRKLPRREMSGGGMAVFSNGIGAGTLARVELIDASWTGVGIKSPIPAEVGSGFSLVPDSPMWPRQTGVVVNCVQDPRGGYRIGVLSKQKKAVA